MILTILASGLVLRLINLDQSLWLDEAINVLAAKNYSLIGIIAEYAKADFHPPGWFIILWIWGKLFGYSEILVRLPSVFFGVLTIFVTYLLGKKLVSKNVGLLAALLLSINPLHIYYSQEARMYALATLAVVINFYLWVRILKEEKVNLLTVVASNLFVLSSDYVVYLIFPAQLLFLSIFKRNTVMLWFKGVLVTFLIGIWWLPMLIKQLSVGSVAAANLPAWRFIVGGFDLRAVPLTLVKFIIGRISLADKFIYYSLLVPVSALFLFLILRAVQLTGRARDLLIIWLIVPIILATFISFVVPIYSYFRLIFTLPAFVVLVALGILSFGSKLRYLFLGAVLLIQIFSTGIYLFNDSYQREDWKGLISFFKGIKPPMILFESSGTLPPFDYYAEGTLNAKGALKDFPVKDESSVADLGALLNDLKELYLVDYLIEISDPKRLVAAKLNELGYKETDIENFNGVGFVYHYVKQ